MSTTTTPSPDWVRFKPAPHECTSCSICSSNTECPSTTHPFNLDGNTNLKCYMCSSCSHTEYNPPENGGTDYKSLVYKKPADRFYTDKYTWYVHIPLEETCNSEIFKYRVALAEMENAKATIYQDKGKDDVPREGLTILIPMRATTEPKMVLQEAREVIKRGLRDLRRLYEMEVHLGVSK